MAQSATTQTLHLIINITTASAFQEVLSDFDLQVRYDLINAFFPEDDFYTVLIQYIHSYPLNTIENYTVYFEDPTREVSPHANIKVTNRHPRVELNAYELKQYPKVDDILVIKGIRYGIDYIDDEGTGVIELYLVKEGKRIQ